MKVRTIAVSGANGEQGSKTIRELSRLGAIVKALVRKPLAPALAGEFKNLNVQVELVNYDDPEHLKRACAGIDCVVSTLSGPPEVILETQMKLLNACIEAKVPRFIPSAYSIDFNDVPPEKNRNLAVLREFDKKLSTAQIQSTTILNGAFADMLTGQAPFILFALKRVIYFSNPDQLMDFTTRDNVATYTAHAALDPNTPRYLRIAGDQVSARGLAAIMTKLDEQEFKLLRVGSISGLEKVIAVVKTLMGKRGGKYPIWQGFQYMHNMFGGLGKFKSTDNARYADLEWTSIEEVLGAFLEKKR